MAQFLDRLARLPRGLRWTGVVILTAAGVLTVLTVWALRPSRIAAMVSGELSRHPQLDASVAEISVRLLPRPHISGRSLTIRVPGRPDLPPFVSIDRFESTPASSPSCANTSAPCAPTD